MKTKRCAVYCRVSSDEQVRFGFSVQNQLDRLLIYAEENNMQVIDVFLDEGFSAGTTKRPALQEMLSRLNEFDEIIFTKLDRFTRNVLDANEMVKVCQINDVAIKAIDEEDIDTSTADGEFIFNMKVSLAQRELKKGSERITTVFSFMVKEGKPITGSMPFGYKIATKENGDKHIIKDEEISHIIDEMFEHFITYQSVRATALHLNQKHGIVKSYNSYYSMLKNEMYAGIYRGNLNYCPPYLSKETFHKVQEIIKNNIKVHKSKYVHILAGLVFCDKCKHKMQVHHKQKTLKDGTKKDYTYYRCRSIIAQPEPCLSRYSEKFLEEKLLQNINSQASEYIIKAQVSPIEAKDNSKEIKDVLDEMDNINYMFRKKRMSQKDYDREYEELEKQLAQLEKETPEKKDVKGIEAFLNSGWENVYQNLSKEDRRALVRSVVKSITFDENGELIIDFL